jgi:hypothetical protein
MTTTFDPTKRYKELECQNGQYVAADDFNHIQDMQNYDKRELQKFLQGFQLVINAMVNSPVLKVRANNGLTEGQVINIEMTDATHAKWNKNGGAWSGAIAVTCDNVTWNTLGVSGLDVVFVDTAVAADASEVWVAQAMRLLGGAMESPVAGTFRILEGKWSILGEYEEFTAPLSVAGCANDDYLYLKVERVEVPHTTDSAIGHRLADGEYAAVSPIAINRTYTMMNNAVFPANVSSPYAHYILVGKVVNAAAGTFIEMWNSPLDIQQFLRLYGDTTAPTTPTGLVLTTGSDQDLIDPTLGAVRIVQQIPLSGYLKMVCNDNPESDIDYYEFKITRLVAVGGALTADSITQLVKTNTDAGGGMTVPLGISYTLHGQQMGVPYRVWVRAVDFAGNVSPWSASADEVIGGSTCTIAAIAAGPTFTLIDTPGFVGITLGVTAVPVGAAGYTVWIGEGAYPTIATNEGFIGNYPASVGVVSIPWKENGRPYVRIKAYDLKGLYQTLYSQDNTTLEATAQLATNSHNESLASHGGLIGDLVGITQTYGSIQRAFAKIEAQGFDIKDVYVVAQNGGFYQTVGAAMTAISQNQPQKALIWIAPGEYTESTLVYPTMTDPSSGAATSQVVVCGAGVGITHIKFDWDLSGLIGFGLPIVFPRTMNIAALTFRDLSFEGARVYGGASSTHGMVVFDNVSMVSSYAGGIIALDALASNYFVILRNSFISNVDNAGHCCHFSGDVNFYISNSELDAQTVGTGNCLYLTAVTGTTKIVTRSLLQVVGATTGKAIDSSVAVNVVTAANIYAGGAALIGANVTRVTGSVDTDTTINADILTLL